MKLLIPILTDALVVDDAFNDKEKGLWARNADNYNKVLQYQKANNPLQRTDEAPTGVHLQWILPDFLCHGRQLEKGELEFPNVPNRWLIRRIWLNDEKAVQVKSWVVLSDFIHDNHSENANYLHEIEGKLISTRIGKVVELNEFQEQPDKKLFLTAVGAGNAAFVNYTPNNDNVFSFIDDLTELDKISTSLSYSVIGWYSNKNDMPKIDTLDIEVPEDFEGDEFICHGGIYDVKWNGKAGDKEKSISGKPKGNFEVVIANSSFDAIVRLVQHRMMIKNKISFDETKQAAQLLLAFEHHLLNKIDKKNGLSELSKARHKSWFTGEEGGTIWTIQFNESQDYYEELLNSSNAYNLLNTLNETQLRIDNHKFNQQSKQTTLYQKWILINRDESNEILQEGFQSILKEVQQLENEIEQHQAIIHQLIQEINTLISEQIGEKAVLKQIMSPSFWEANEPVILVATEKTSDKYGFDRQLKIRTSAEIIENINEFYTKKQIRLQLPNESVNPKIPTEAYSLLKEAILLNPTISSYLYQQFKKEYSHDSTSAESIQKQQTLIWNDEIYQEFDGDSLLGLAGFSGQDDHQTIKRPALRSFSKVLPTWSPMFLDWEVDYYPNGDLSVSNWKFNEFDYEFDDNQNQFDEHTKITLSGRSILTTQPVKVLEQHLKDYKKSLIDDAEKLILDEVIRTIKETDIITQRLSGFNEMLLGFDINDIVPLSQNDKILVKAFENANLGLPLNLTTTYPLRGGFLVPKTIRITDDFGLAIYPFLEKHAYPQLFLKSDALNHSAINDSYIVKLPPRIVQPSRLTLNWIGNKTNKPITIANDDNPIIGWLMTDYLDKSLEVFSPTGKNIGELITYKRGQKTEARWLPNDGQQIPNDLLNRLINSIIEYTNSASALAALMRSVDDGLAEINLSNNNPDAFVILFGQPLALVRASIKLEVKGITDNRLANIDFNIRLSNEKLLDNGVIGYFKNNLFEHFHSNYNKDLSDYIKSSTVEKIKVNQPLEVVFLMNPSGLVHLNTGVLPTVEINIPERYITPAINNMSMSFRVGPIISEPDNLQIIKPSDENASLIWQQHGQDENSTFSSAKSEGNFPIKRNTLNEGWLKLKK